MVWSLPIWICLLAFVVTKWTTFQPFRNEKLTSCKCEFGVQDLTTKNNVIWWMSDIFNNQSDVWHWAFLFLQHTVNSTISLNWCNLRTNKFSLSRHGRRGDRCWQARPGGAVLFNHSESDFDVKPSGHVAQMIVQVISTPEDDDVEVLDATVREREDSCPPASEFLAL